MLKDLFIGDECFVRCKDVSLQSLGLWVSVMARPGVAEDDCVGSGSVPGERGSGEHAVHSQWVMGWGVS